MSAPIEAPDARQTRRRWIRRAVVLVLLLACAHIVVGLVGQIDWSEVGDALSKLEPWQFPLLLLVLLVRQWLNSAPLAFFIRGLGFGRAFENDQAAILMASVAPPPTDLVLRVTMFRSWGIEDARGLAGAVMNTLTFYVIRFAAPMLGLAVVGLTNAPFHPVYVAVAVVGAGVTVALFASMWLILRRDQTATALAAWAGRTVRRVRRSVDPDRWVTWALDFRSHVVGRVRTGLPRSLVSLVAMVTCDGFLLVMAIRFVGVPTGAAPAALILSAFLIAYPLTSMFVSGLGLLDALVLAIVVDETGIAYEPELVAGLIVWRITTLITPLILGALSVGWWRWTEARR